MFLVKDDYVFNEKEDAYIFFITVLEIHGDYITIKLEDITEPEREDEIAEVDISKLDEDDVDNVYEGQWGNFIIYPDERKPEFRLFPSQCWTKEEVEDVKKRAKERYDSFWNDLEDNGETTIGT